MLTILRIEGTPIVLREELGSEDLACLLDLLRGAQTVEGVPVDVTVGFEWPQCHQENLKSIFQQAIQDEMTVEVQEG